VDFTCESSTPLDADAVIAALAAAFPGTRVVHEDFYADRLAECERAGLGPESAPVARFRQFRGDEGVVRVFDVPVEDGLVIRGRLGGTGGDFVSDRVCLRRQAQRLIDVLSASGLRVSALKNAPHPSPPT
jgi:hypothetical protein